MEGKKRTSVYNPEADKKWRENNRERSNHIAQRGAARSFIRNRATAEDLDELEQLIGERREALKG